MLPDTRPFANNSSFVDVGGSRGNVAINVSERYPHMMCIVQDLPDATVQGASRVPIVLKKC